MFVRGYLGTSLIVVKEFHESKSAKSIGREVFNEMMKFIEEGNADGILCWKLDRLARNPIDEGIIKHLLQSGKIKAIKTSEKEFLSEDNAIFTGLEFAMAIQYSRDLSKNVKRGNREKLKRGWWPSKAPFGYKNARGNTPIILDKEVAPLLKYAFKRYAKGNISIKELNNELYKKGLRTESGKKLTPSALHHKLHNPFYYGLMVRNGETFQGKHKPIITKEIFEQVQDIGKEKSKPRAYKHFFPYRGFLICEDCGCSLTADKKKGHTYYYCTNGKGICDAHRQYVRSEVIDKQITKEIAKLKFPKEIIELMYDASLQQRGITKEAQKQQKEKLKKLLKQCLQAQDKLFTSYSRGKTPETIYERKIKELEQEQKELEQEIDKKVSNDLSTFERTKEFFLLANKTKKDFKHGDDIKKRKILETVLSNVYFSGQEVSKTQYKLGFQSMAKVLKNAEMSVLLGW